MLTVKFTSGEIAQGTAWNSLPTQRISALKYRIGNKIVYLTGFEEYNHLVEKVAGFGKPPQTTKIFLCGRWQGKTKVVTIDLTTKQITQKTTEIGQEYNGQVTTGWRSGEGSFEPTLAISDAIL